VSHPISPSAFCPGERTLLPSGRRLIRVGHPNVIGLKGSESTACGRSREERHHGGCTFLEWAGFTGAQYDAVRSIVGFEREDAPGGLFHVAAIDEHGIHVTDVWETEEDFQSYFTNKLMPAFAQIGVTGQPEVEIIPVHALHTLGFKRI
jgi:hypothetical protein